MLKVDKIQTGYGRLKVLNDVELTVGAGECVCVIGPNGAGKTTLLHALCGTLPLHAGSITLDGEAIGGLDPTAIIGRGIAVVPEGRRVFGPLTVRENLLMGAYLRARAGQGDEVQKDIEACYGLFPILRERADQQAGYLSGGEQQMLAIGRAMMSRPKLLMLDEPSMGLAPLIVKNIFKILDELRGRTTILLVEQNARIALHLSDRGYVLERGRVVAHGRRDELLRDETILKTYLGG